MDANQCTFFSDSFGIVSFNPIEKLKQSALLENEDIIVSRRANSYVLTAVTKGKTYQASAKKANGVEKMLKKAGAGKYGHFFLLFQVLFKFNLKDFRCERLIHFAY